MAAKKNPPPVRLRMNMHNRMAFSREEYERRYRLVIDGMRAAKVDALLVRSPENITYLTGYETPGYYGYHCLILVSGHQPVLVGRRLEVGTNVPEFSWLTKIAYVEDYDIPVEITIKTVSKLGLARKRLGIEPDGWFFTVNEHKALTEALPRARFVDCSALVESARMIKSPAEVKVMRKAVAIADKACLAGIRATRPGVSEDDIAAAVYKTWCAAGAEYTGLPNFIVSGRRSGACHATWRLWMRAQDRRQRPLQLRDRGLQEPLLRGGVSTLRRRQAQAEDPTPRRSADRSARSGGRRDSSRRDQ